MDVDNDTFVTPMDILTNINELNGRSIIDESGQLPDPPPPLHGYPDVNGDGYLTAVDPLIDINFLYGSGGLPVSDQDSVEIRLETTNPWGVPISDIDVGEEFLLRAFVEDLRSVPKGVFAAYLDVFYDAPLASVAGPITFGADYGNGQSGDTVTGGLIDEVGSFSSKFQSLGAGEFLLFSLPFRADAAGQVIFASDPADVVPAHDALLYGVIRRPRRGWIRSCCGV